MSRRPENWPPQWRLRLYREPCCEPEWQVLEKGRVVAQIYRGSRGWAFASADYGSAGHGWSGFDTMTDAMRELAKGVAHV